MIGYEIDMEVKTLYRVTIDDLIMTSDDCVIDIRNQADYEKET